MKNHRRHGDVILKATDKLPEGLTKVEPSMRNNKWGYTLALGEVTGHAHVLENLGEGLEAYTDSNGTMYLVVPEGLTAPVTHEEHARIDLPAGVFSVVIQREYTPEGWVNVAD